MASSHGGRIAVTPQRRFPVSAPASSPAIYLQRYRLVKMAGEGYEHSHVGCGRAKAELEEWSPIELSQRSRKPVAAVAKLPELLPRFLLGEPTLLRHRSGQPCGRQRLALAPAGLHRVDTAGALLDHREMGSGVDQ